MSLTIEQKATNAETLEHIRTVQRMINKIIAELIARADVHDDSKLKSPEVEIFAEYTSKLAGCTYGSPEYEGYRKAMGPALEHHYAKNRHHPEHWKNGVYDMNIVDLVEMLCDWKSATLRHNDGNLNKSIEHNAKRFDMSPQLAKIFQNSVGLFE